MDLSSMREEFTTMGLSRADLLEDPVKQFEKWFRQADEGGVRMPNAMTLATATRDGKPTARTVLLKFFDQQGFVFYTNYESKKSKDIAENDQVSLLFFWMELDRQVRINGRAERVSTGESLKYFLSRPRGSQLGAWVSNQSSPVSSRQMLMSKFEEIKKRFEQKEVSLPEFWGGFRVIPEYFEFWQGRENRMHDRFAFEMTGSGDWQIERLAP